MIFSEINVERFSFRSIGDDVKIGELVLEKDGPLGPAELGLLATVGLQTVRVYDKPRLAILSTGNEVRHQRLSQSMFSVISSRSSFRLMHLPVTMGKSVIATKLCWSVLWKTWTFHRLSMGAQLKTSTSSPLSGSFQCCPIFDRSEGSVIQTLQAAFDRADVVISTGGVSMGDKVTNKQEKDRLMPGRCSSRI